jgi:hypothetical protein
MKRLLFLLLITFLFSCKKEKEPCFICNETAKNVIVRTWETCNVLDASNQNGRRWITYTWHGNVREATVHMVTCSQE